MSVATEKCIWRMSPPTKPVTMDSPFPDIPEPPGAEKEWETSDPPEVGGKVVPMCRRVLQKPFHRPERGQVERASPGMKERVSHRR
jgi:hypothetical protein